MANLTNTKKELESYLDNLSALPKTFSKGEIIKGSIVKVKEGEVLIDVGGRAEGVISGRELSLNGKREKVTEGQEMIVYVVNPENDKGQLELSIRKTGEDRKWQKLQDVIDKGETITVEVVEVNNGGVIVTIDENFRGFIPTSQLKNSRIYPLDGFDDKKQAARELQKKLTQLIGEKIVVKIIEINKKKNRVILSEKLVDAEADGEKRSEKLKASKVGSIIEGEVTGIAPFGLFVNSSGLEGLVHLSEISWDKVENPADFYKVGDKVKVQVIGIEDDGRRIAYSIKRLQEDPWLKIINKYKIGQKVKGTVQKIVNYGAFVRIDKEVNGLIHISELSDGLVTDPSKFVKIGDEYELEIISISKSERHLGLSLKRASKSGKRNVVKSEKSSDTKPEKSKKEESAPELDSLGEA